jgi:hypothetical protein
LVHPSDPFDRHTIGHLRFELRVLLPGPRTAATFGVQVEVSDADKSPEWENPDHESGPAGR